MKSSTKHWAEGMPPNRATIQRAVDAYTNSNGSVREAIENNPYENGWDRIAFNKIVRMVHELCQDMKGVTEHVRPDGTLKETGQPDRKRGDGVPFVVNGKWPL